MKKAAIFVLLLILLGFGLVLYKGRSIYKPQNLAPTTTQPSSTVEPTETPVQIQEISLTITSPTDGTTVTDSQVTVSGQTAANADVSINDEEIKADSQGKFSREITLDEGDNIIDVTANDANGQAAEKQITVTYQPGTATQ